MKNLSLPSALLLAALTMTLTSCSRSPVAPETGAAGQPGTTTTGVLEQDGPPATQGGTPNVVTFPFLTGEEGRFNAGRWTVWVRKNSIKMPATIKLSVADAEAMECQIEVSPPEANDFQQPVIVSANTSDVPNVNYGTWKMLEWDAAWVAMDNTSAHPHQENIVGHAVTLKSSYTLGEDPNDKWKNK